MSKNFKLEIDYGIGSVNFPEKFYQAFDELNDLNIVAGRMPCCQSCGHGEMKEIIENNYIDSGSYIFFHDQDYERYLTTGELYLAYNLTEETKKTVMQVLIGYDLKPEWNWSDKQRIKITIDERKNKDDEKKEQSITSKAKEFLYGKVEDNGKSIN